MEIVLIIIIKVARALQCNTNILLLPWGNFCPPRLAFAPKALHLEYKLTVK